MRRSKPDDGILLIRLWREALHPVYLITLDPVGDDDEELEAGEALTLPHTRLISAHVMLW